MSINAINNPQLNALTGTNDINKKSFDEKALMVAKTILSPVKAPLGKIGSLGTTIGMGSLMLIFLMKIANSLGMKIPGDSSALLKIGLQMLGIGVGATFLNAVADPKNKTFSDVAKSMSGSLEQSFNLGSAMAKYYGQKILSGESTINDVVKELQGKRDEIVEQTSQLKEQLTNIDRLKELGTKGMETLIQECDGNFAKLQSALDKPMKLALSETKYKEFKELKSVDDIKQFVQNIKEEMAEKSKLTQQKLNELGIAQHDNQALLNQYLGNTTQVTKSNEPTYKPDEKKANNPVENNQAARPENNQQPENVEAQQNQPNAQEVNQGAARQENNPNPVENNRQEVRQENNPVENNQVENNHNQHPGNVQQNVEGQQNAQEVIPENNQN